MIFTTKSLFNSLRAAFHSHQTSKMVVVHYRSTPVIPVLGRLRREGRDFEVSLGNIVRSCLQKKQEE
jgi:hypothetical protein